MLELVDEADSKSVASDGVWVRVPPPAPCRVVITDLTLLPLDFSFASCRSRRLPALFFMLAWGYTPPPRPDGCRLCSGRPCGMRCPAARYTPRSGSRSQVPSVSYTSMWSISSCKSGAVNVPISINFRTADIKLSFLYRCCSNPSNFSRRLLILSFNSTRSASYL